jgi:hypothetical protein
MYEQNEIEISKKYLKEVIASIDEPIVLVGGWAIYFLVNKSYRETTGRDYIGSRDIDLGLKLSSQNLERSAFAKSYDKLTKDLGFRQLSFRLFKEIHTDTGETLNQDEAKKLPIYQIFPMYVDLVVDTIPDNFRKHFGFTPVDEPLLKYVFASEKNRIILQEFEKTIWIPTPEILMATKIKAVPNRDKDHKRIKDLCDITAILLFSSISPIKKVITKYIKRKEINNFINLLTKKEIQQVADIIDLDPTLIDSAILKLK